MTSYPYIKSLYTNVLSKSDAIQGRFHLLVSTGGTEINSDILKEVLPDLVVPASGKKYPLVLMMPPRSTGIYDKAANEWDQYINTLFFLKTSYYNSNNQPQSNNVNTRTSQHSIDLDWHDMRRCAINFITVLSQVVKNNMLQANVFRLVNEKRQITPVSVIGTDRISGVRLDFKAELFAGCELEDYEAGDIPGIPIPALDSHPQHNL